MESSDILTRSQKFDKISPISLTLVGNFKKGWIFSKFCGLLTISGLYGEFGFGMACQPYSHAPFVSKSKKEKFVGSTSVAYSPKVV